MYDDIIKLADNLENKLINYRRDFHKYAETGWLELRTASIIARRLTDLGYEVLVGEDVCQSDSRMGLPDKDVLDKNYVRAKEQGADLEFLDKVKNGYTGVIGILNNCDDSDVYNGDGPVVAMRFDIDALGVIEDCTVEHIPTSEGFSSVNEGFMHACGHDGHAAIGLGVAEVLMNLKDKFRGKVKLIFQPAEEGVRGAKSIVDKGHLDDVNYLLGAHISNNSNSNADLCPGACDALATTKLDVYYHGVSSHAGGCPEKGKNVMLSAATAILNLYAIPRNSKGATRINVGTINAGTGRNVIADIAKLEVEIRGETTEINQYVEDYAIKILEAAALMHGTTVEIKKMGGAYSLTSDKSLMDRVRRVCEENLPEIKVTDFDTASLGGSEDFSYMMKRVQDNGGEATFMMTMTEVFAPAHNRLFDFNERVLVNAVKVFSAVTYDILKYLEE